MQLRYQLFRNSFSTLIQIFATTALGLVLPPVLLAHVGLDAYGTWALIILVNSYVTLLDLGFQSGMVKLISEAHVRLDSERILALVNSSLWIYLVIFLVGTITTFVIGDIATSWLLSSVQVPERYSTILEIYAVGCFAGLPIIPFSALLKGLQRYDQANLIEIAAMAINAGVSIILVLIGWGLWALVLGATAAVFFRIVAYGYFSYRAFPSIRFRIVSMKDFRALIPLIRLSPADQSVRIYSVVTQSVVRLAIGTYAGVSFVGVYDIAKRIVGQLSGVSTIVFIPLVPAVSSLAAQGKHDSLDELLRRCMSYINMLTLPLTLFMLIFYEPVMRAWLRVQDVSAISFAGRFLLIAAFVEMLTGPATTVALGLGTASLHVLKLGVTGILNVALVLGFGRQFHFSGVIAGETLATVVGSIVGLVAFETWFGLRILRTTASSIAQVILRAGPVWAALSMLWLAFPNLPIWGNLMTWAGMLFIGLSLIATSYWLTGLVSSYEFDLARNAFARRINPPAEPAKD